MIAAFTAAARADTLAVGNFVFTPARTVDISGAALPPGTANGGNNVLAGAFGVTLNSTQSFLAYCIELTETVALGGSYTSYSTVSLVSYARTTPPGAIAFDARKGTIARLLDLYFGEATTLPGASAVKSAALQLALWEGVHETDTTTPFSLSTGNFLGIGDPTVGSPDAIRAQGNTYLAALDGTPGNIANYGVFASLTRQDLIAPSPAPVPAPLALFAAGLGLFGVVARRRAKR